MTHTFQKTALHDLHQSFGGRIVDFAGYALPVQFAGIVAEHNQTRSSASLFDVSHMGQITVSGASDAQTAEALERLLPADIKGLAPSEMRYSVLLNANGTIEDDLIVTRPAANQAPAGTFFIVVNAARKAHDLKIFQEHLNDQLRFELHEDRALLALQGPMSAKVLARHCDAPNVLAFMQSCAVRISGFDVVISRSGYTGEDGFELSVANENAVALASLLLNESEVEPAGLGARDSLRLEAGLCLYGHDMDDRIDPVSAGLLFAIGKDRRTNGGFPGFEHIKQIRDAGPATKRFGVRFEGRLPVREGAEMVDADGQHLGKVTSGTYSPTLASPIAMAYLPATCTRGDQVFAIVRGKKVSGTIERMPFVAQNYKREPGI